MKVFSGISSAALLIFITILSMTDSLTFQDVRDHELLNKLIFMVKDMNYKAGDADCVLLLLCKLKPFVWSMQKAITERIVGDEKQHADDMNNRANTDRMSIFFKYVPSLEEFKNNGVECEDAFKTCKLF